MHQNNPYLKQKPDFARLASRYPKFAPFVNVSEDGYPSINFQDPTALRELTKCLLKEDWGLDVDLREDRLCPTIPNRLDYIYHVLDLEPHLPSSSLRPLRILDIGTGATAIYPILLSRLRPDSRIVATGGLYLDRLRIGADYCQRSTKVPTTMPRQHLRRIIYLHLRSPY